MILMGFKFSMSIKNAPALSAEFYLNRLFLKITVLGIGSFSLSKFCNDIAPPKPLQWFLVNVLFYITI